MTKYNIIISRILLAYIWGSYIIYLILPIQPVDLGRNEIYSFIFLVFISIAIYYGCKSIPIPRSQTLVDNDSLLLGVRITTILLLLVIVVGILYERDFLTTLGIATITANMGENYELMLEMDTEFNMTSRIGQIYTLISPIRYFLLVYCCYYYSKIGKINKYLFLVLVALALFHSVFVTGTQKGVGDVVILLLVAIAIKELKKNRIKRIIKIAGISLSVFLVFFTLSQITRSEALGNDAGLSSNAYYSYDENNIVCKLLGKNVGEGVIRFGLYFSNGYPGLNYCLQMPFEWTNGYGGSRAADDYLHRYLGLPSKFKRTYPLRMEDTVGWPGLLYWPSAYAWWASDLSFPGVVVFMFFLARFLCVLFKEAYCKGNPLSIVLLSYFSIMVVYLPANNQLLQSSANFISTVVLFITWVLFHKKYNNPIKYSVTK